MPFAFFMKKLFNRWKSVAKLGLLLVLLVTLYQALQALFHDWCGGIRLTQALCEEYFHGNVAGSQCFNLCKERLPLLHQCTHNRHGYTYFLFNDSVVSHVSQSTLSRLRTQPQLLNQLYSFPPEGQEDEEFAHHVQVLLQEELGLQTTDHMLPRLMQMADVNQNDKMSLAEARSLWAIIKDPEFLYLYMLQDTNFVPKFLGSYGDVIMTSYTTMQPLFHTAEDIDVCVLQGSCGDVIMTSYTPLQPLFRTAEEHPMLRRVYPNWPQWTYPTWRQRAKIVLGILEIAMETHQHGDYGALHLCDVTAFGRSSDAGRSSNRRSGAHSNSLDVYLSNLSALWTPTQILRALQHVACDKDADCAISPVCISRCDLRLRSCTPQLVRPPLAAICGYIRGFIMTGAPRPYSGDLAMTLDKCERLANNQSDADLRFSVVHNDLRMLLWRQVAY